MKKRTMLSWTLVLSIVGIGIAILFGEHQNNTSQINQVNKHNYITDIHELHSDILRLIVSKNETIYKITPESALKELEDRAGRNLEIDQVPTDVKKLPFDIVRAIAKSPATIAGITPKAAIRELVKRYLSIDLTDSDDVDSSILLEALQHREEQKAIDEWAKNEDAEAVEAFMKEEADRDPSSITNFAYGLKNLEKNHDIALSYMDRYANHAHSDAFDNQNTEKAHKVLIEAIKKLKK